MHKLRSVDCQSLEISIFATQLGWFGLTGAAQEVSGLTIGHGSADEVRAAVKRQFDQDPCEVSTSEADWFPALRRKIEQYARGVRFDFERVDICLPEGTSFQHRVLNLTRKIEYGRRMTYGELALQAGSPQAARAVGNVMAGNRLPLIIPCHRVVASGGKWGGFSAPQGVSLKRRLLEMEADSLDPVALS